MAGILARRLSLSLSSRHFSSAAVQSINKVAVVLSGCGVYDGTEIHESSAVLVHLSRMEVEVGMYAPDAAQMHVIDHSKGEPVEGQTRNAMVEAARIARGNISPLSSLTADKYDGVVFPGGFGAAKNLSTFASKGADMKVIPDVERVLKEFHQAKKPIGLCCISPVLAAKVLRSVEVTVGSDEDPAAKAIETMGAKHIQKKVTESHTDDQNRVVTTPAYMCEAPLHNIFDGIGCMIGGVMRFILKK